MNKKLNKHLDICAVIVTYLPDASFETRLNAISKQVSMVLIVDNGSDAQRSMLRELTINERVLLIENEKNLGIATALNIGIQRAIDLGYEWVLLFDQDTLAHNNLCQSLCDIYASYPAPKKIALIGANYSNVFKPIADLDSKQSYQLVKRVITSGTLLSIVAYQKIGRFNDEYFIDMVDLEYCVRATRLGFTLLKSTALLMTHSVGFPTKHSLFGKKIWLNNHSPLRRYYYVRNYVVFQREYGKYRFGGWAVKSLRKSIRLVFLILLFESNKQSKIKAILIGWLDGFNQHMGEKKLF